MSRPYFVTNDTNSPYFLFSGFQNLGPEIRLTLHYTVLSSFELPVLTIQY